MHLKIYSDQLGIIKYPLIYAFAENEAFYCEKIAPYEPTITHVVHVRYGGGLGGGGNSRGAWLQNILKNIKCEVLITSGIGGCWGSGDDIALEICSSIPKEHNTKLEPIREIEGKLWSNYGNVSWNLIK